MSEILDETFPFESLPRHLRKLALDQGCRAEVVREGPVYLQHVIAGRPQLLQLLSSEERDCLLTRSPYNLYWAYNLRDRLPARIGASIERLTAKCPDPYVRMRALGKHFDDELVGRLATMEVEAEIPYRDVCALLEHVLYNPDEKQLPTLKKLVCSLIASPNWFDRKLAVYFPDLTTEQVRRLLFDDNDGIRLDALAAGHNLNSLEFEELFKCVEGDGALVSTLFDAYRNGYRTDKGGEVSRLMKQCSQSEDPHIRRVSDSAVKRTDTVSVLHFPVPLSPFDGRFVLKYMGYSISLRAADVLYWAPDVENSKLPMTIRMALKELNQALSEQRNIGLRIQKKDDRPVRREKRFSDIGSWLSEVVSPDLSR